ncbi:hypothetical protein [Falsiphaeobacter marinintestinus]|uniref:hypothetical protein n=1 Tax=Falsiphaeobacter marinintestinus TaxID=1492905 RepID=UPI0011B8205D|nr:hypothetical protein [Phaeobacter marinintestinus]
MTDSYDDCLTIAHSELRLARKILQDEISGYPTPIAGCDAQFNHLLAQRRRILSALSALQEDVFVPTPRQPRPDVRVESR